MPEIYPIGFEGQARRQFGELANRIGILSIDLAIARNRQSFKIGGTFLRAVDASSLNANCELALNNYGSDAIPVKQSGGFRGLAFNEILVTNAAQPGESITFLYVTEGVTRDFEIFPNAADFTQITVSKAATGADIADTNINNGSTATITADADRRVLRVYAPITNAGYLRVGPGAAAGRGWQLPPGGFMDFKGTFAVNIHNESGGALNYGYMTFGD